MNTAEITRKCTPVVATGTSGSLMERRRPTRNVVAPLVALVLVLSGWALSPLSASASATSGAGAGKDPITVHHF